MISIQASWRYSSMIDAISTRSGYLSLIALNSSSQVLKSRSLISSIFSQPMISCESAARRRPYRGCTLTTFEASRLMVLHMTAPQPSSNALPMTLALVPGGPEAMTKGLGSVRPSTVVLRSGIEGYLLAKLSRYCGLLIESIAALRGEGRYKGAAKKPLVAQVANQSLNSAANFSESAFSTAAAP